MNNLPTCETENTDDFGDELSEYEYHKGLWDEDIGGLDTPPDIWHYCEL